MFALQAYLAMKWSWLFPHYKTVHSFIWLDMAISSFQCAFVVSVQHPEDKTVTLFFKLICESIFGYFQTGEVKFICYCYEMQIFFFSMNFTCTIPSIPSWYTTFVPAQLMKLREQGKGNGHCPHKRWP